MKDYHCPLFSKDLGPTIFHQNQTLAQEVATAEEWKMIKSYQQTSSHAENPEVGWMDGNTK